MSYRSPSYFADRCRQRAGFTLAELLVVVAIVAVLVAIAVPVFTSALGSTEEATCDANRRSVKSMYTNAWLLNQDQNQQELFGNCVAKLNEQNGNDNPGVNELCPNKGDYSATFDSNGAAFVKCSVHGLSDEDKVNGWIASNAWSGKTDSDSREKFAKANNLTEWPKIAGTDGKPVYLSFKSYGNSSDTAYLFAGKSQSVSDGNPWRANYICDTTGEIFGTPGQWYQLPKEMNLGTSPDKTGAALRNKLSETFGSDYANTLQKVVLEAGKFTAA